MTTKIFSEFILFVLLLLNVAYSIDNMVPIDDDTICRLFQLSNRQHKHMKYCCSSPLVESRKSLCSHCNHVLSSTNNNYRSEVSMDNSNRNPTSVYEYNFIVGIMKQVTSHESMSSANEDDTDELSTTTTSPALSMNKICPQKLLDATTNTIYFDFFKNLPSNINNLRSIIAKSVSYFSTSGKYCTNLPNIDEDGVRHNKKKVDELLDLVLAQAYRGIPYCENDHNIIRNRIGQQNIHEEVLESPNYPQYVRSQMYALSADQTPSKTHTDTPSPQKPPTTPPYKPGYRAWLATFASILVISVVSVAMIVIVGLRRNIKVYRYVLEVFVASAVAALLTDALLHLYPHSLGVEHENHHHHDDDHTHTHNDVNKSIYSSTNHIWKGIIVVATLYIFYLIEYLMLIIPKFIGANVHHHHHHHHHDHFHQSQHNEVDKDAAITGTTDDDDVTKQIESFKLLKNDKILQGTQNPDCKVVCRVDDHIAQHRFHSGVPMDCVEHIQEVHASEQVHASELVDSDPDDNNTVSSNVKDPTTSNSVTAIANKNRDSIHTPSDDNEKPLPATSDNSTPIKMSSGGILAELMNVDKVVWMLTIGDALHNCIDGIIIAIQFMEEWPDGLFKGIMTSVAILCHEVPHEVGDYAAMLASGLSIKKAIFFNCLATIACLFGGVIGCCLGSAIGTSWIEPIVAGIFIYIALTVLMPNLIKSLESAKSPFKLFLCHTLGYFFGSAILITISFHEGVLMPHSHH